MNNAMPEPGFPAVVCSVLERDAKASIRQLTGAPAGCALVELRADRLRAEQVAEVVREVGRPLIVTVRRRDDGGEYDGSEEERRASLQAALDAGARFVDVEQGSGLADLARGASANRAILSHHGADCRTAELAELHREMAGSPAARLKIVPLATRPADAGPLRSLLRDQRDSEGRLACFALGRAGAVSRLMACSWGSWGTYGSVARDRATAPGQFSAADLLDVYDVLRIGPDTRIVGLVGKRVFSSPSPAMHCAAIRDAGIDARYFALEIDELADVLPLASADGLLGLEALAVTIPFKEQAAAMARAADELVRVARAANTLCREHDGWVAHNTDGPGALACIRQRLDPRGAAVAVVGAGGTARALAIMLRGAGARVSLFSRPSMRAERSAESLGLPLRPLNELAGADWEVLVQATPLGSDGESWLAPEALRGKLVLDAVYGREATPLIAAARQRGLMTIDGIEMLASQAAIQFEKIFGRRTDVGSMKTDGLRWLHRVSS